MQIFFNLPLGKGRKITIEMFAEPTETIAEIKMKALPLLQDYKNNYSL